MLWYGCTGWNSQKKTSSAVSDHFPKGLSCHCWQELPFSLAATAQARTEWVWRLPTFCWIIFCWLRGHCRDNEVGFVFTVAQPQLRQDYNMQAIALAAPFKIANPKQILLFFFFLERTWLHEALNMF